MTIVHDIFVRKSINNASDIKNMKHLMYTVATFNKYRSNIIEDASKMEEANINLVNIEDTSIIPDEKDKLFWCCYIAYYGTEKYNNVKRRSGNVSMEEKQKISEHFKKTPNLLKNINQKMTKARMQEIISEIMVNGEITLNALPAFSLYYRMRILLIKEDRIFLNISGEDLYDKTVIIRKNSDKEYAIDIDSNDNKIKEIMENCICLYNNEKPLKAISNFKMNELKDLAERVNIDIDQKTTKQELYASISRKCIW